MNDIVKGIIDEAAATGRRWRIFPDSDCIRTDDPGMLCPLEAVAVGRGFTSVGMPMGFSPLAISALGLDQRQTEDIMAAADNRWRGSDELPIRGYMIERLQPAATP